MIKKICKNDICCIIITYNPSNELEKLLNIIINQVSKIIIIDNFSKEENYKLIQSSKQFDKITIIRNNFNLGIAKALNQGLSFAKELGFNWAITFDQDTIPFSDIVDTLLDVYNDFFEKDLIGAIGVNSIDINNNLYLTPRQGSSYSIREYVITSGTLLSLQSFTDINGFFDDLFIDNVDIDYSIRLKLNGKISLLTSKCGMVHKPGNSISKKYFGINIESFNHNSLRKYYMSRNNFILTKKYIFRLPLFILKMNFFYLISLLKMIIVENDRRRKIKFTFKGIYDGLTYNLLNKKHGL